MIVLSIASTSKFILLQKRKSQTIILWLDKVTLLIQEIPKEQDDIRGMPLKKNETS